MALQTQRRRFGYGATPTDAAPQQSYGDFGESAQVNPNAQRTYADGGGYTSPGLGYGDSAQVNPNAQRTYISGGYGDGYDNFSGSPYVNSYQFSRYNPNYDAGGPQTFNPDLTTEDPARMAQQDRTSWYDRGNRIDSDYAREAADRYQMENRYRQPMDSAYNQLAQTPGYMGEEQDAIMNRGSMPDPLSQQQIDGMYLTENERGGIAGDPNYYAWFNPSQTQGIAENTAGGLNGAVDDWGNSSRGAWSGMSENTRSAIRNSNLGPSQDYMDQQDSGILGGESGVRGALGQYSGQIGSTLGTGAGNVRSFTNDPSLNASSDYMQNYQFGPEAQAEMEQSAANSVGANTRALRDRVDMAAAQSGYNSPMAMASAQQQLQQQGDSDASDAMLNARVASHRLGLDVTQGRENTRLGAAQNRAALGSQAELGLQRNALGAYSDLSGQTTSNEQALANRRMGAAGERENFRSDAERTRMAANLQNEQNLGQSLMQQENVLGNARTNSIYQGGQMQQQANLANQQMGTNIAQAKDKVESERAAQIAQNRQDVARYGQATQYQQGFNNNQAMSNRAAGIADARRQGQSEYRGFLAGQTNSQMQAGQAARTGRTQAFGTQSGAANQATSNAIGYKTNNPSFARTLGQSTASNLGKWAGPF